MILDYPYIIYMIKTDATKCIRNIYCAFFPQWLKDSFLKYSKTGNILSTVEKDLKHLSTNSLKSDQISIEDDLIADIPWWWYSLTLFLYYSACIVELTQYFLSMRGVEYVLFERLSRPTRVIFSQQTAVKPAVHLLQIQEVHLGPHSSACNFCLFYLFFHTCPIDVILHFQDSRQRPEDRATLLLSSRSGPITWRHP